MAKHNDPDMLTLDEAAQEFGVSRRTLERLRQNGILPGSRSGRFLYVHREDVRRALTFSDPIPLLRYQLAAPGDMLVEQWMEGWMQLTVRTANDDDLRQAQRRWADEASRRFGNQTISEYQVRHAIEAAEAAGVDGPVSIFVAAMRGLPEDRLVVDVLRELVPLFNPLIPHNGESSNGSSHTGKTSDGR